MESDTMSSRMDMDSSVVIPRLIFSLRSPFAFDGMKNPTSEIMVIMPALYEFVKIEFQCLMNSTVDDIC